MTRPSGEDETSIGGEPGIPFDVELPESLSFIGITYEQWGHLRRQVENIGPIENLWFTTSLAFLTFSISFVINIILPGSVENWVEIVLWVGTATGLVGAVLCFIAYRANSKRRKDDIQAVLSFMDGIRRTNGE